MALRRAVEDLSASNPATYSGEYLKRLTRLEAARGFHQQEFEIEIGGGPQGAEQPRPPRGLCAVAEQGGEGGVPPRVEEPRLLQRPALQLPQRERGGVHHEHAPNFF